MSKELNPVKRAEMRVHLTEAVKQLSLEDYDELPGVIATRLQKHLEAAGLGVYKVVHCPVPDGDADALWDECYEIAQSLTSEEVMDACLEATEVVWDSGADHAYAELVKREGITEANADHFHGVWLTAFRDALWDAQEGTRPLREDAHG